MLERMLERLGRSSLPCEADMADKLCAFHALLVQANARMNLTRVSDDPDEAIDRNYLDSLAPLELVRGAQSCVDVGSGAGFPGIPLSIFLPQTRFVLLEAQARRVEFLREAICRLRLNAEAVCMRAEDAARAPWREAFDCAVSRAVAPLRVLCELTLPLVRVGGRVVALQRPQRARGGRAGRKRAGAAGRRDGAGSSRGHPRPRLGTHPGRIGKDLAHPGQVPPPRGNPRKAAAVGRLCQRRQRYDDRRLCQSLRGNAALRVADARGNARAMATLAREAARAGRERVRLSRAFHHRLQRGATCFCRTR